MPVNDAIAARAADLVAWRRDLHAHPETAFEEHRTAETVGRLLESWGYSVHRGLAGTGVVGTLTTGEGPSIGLRADMDALPIQEAGKVSHRSTYEGRMHACGHDGHVAMLLGAARHLAEARSFRGTVRVIFQPAEENEGGGRVMVEQGLFERFPVDAVYGLHNWPGLEVGRFAVRAGTMMAAFDVFEITVEGRGCHGAMPHLGTDAVVAAAQMVLALQTVVSRATDPLDAAVVSVTRIQGGDTWNVIPGQVVLAGSARSLRPEVREEVESGLRRVVAGVAAAHGVEARVRYERRYPPTVNTGPEASLAAAAARDVLGEGAVDEGLKASMGAEDFACMLEARPGAYAWLGAGVGGSPLHSPRYDFNDDILVAGASWWVRLVQRACGA
ncbi:MAG: amidohydrolase [Myxococcales bacterium]